MAEVDGVEGKQHAVVAVVQARSNVSWLDLCDIQQE